MFGLVFRSLLGVLVLPLRVLLTARRVAGMGRRAVVEVVVGGGSKRESLGDRLGLHRTLLQVAADPRVKAVRVEIRSAGMGLSALQALRESLEAVKRSGKRIFVRMDSGDDRSIYLASVADEVWMPPGGEVLLTGLGASMMFFGPALERLGLVVEVQAAGVFKSFGEPFYRGFPTAPNREATLAMLDGLQGHISEQIAEGRGLSKEALEQAMETGLMGAQAAIEHGLIDSLGYPDELEAAMEAMLGGKPKVRSLERYRRGRRLTDWIAALSKPGPAIAVVYLQGPVVERAAGMGSSRRVIASDEVVPVLDAIRQDSQIKGVVLVVESPGGSALASDLIARAVERLDADKPVVASMETVAASGGYYISAPAREIVARRMTLTGSIGVIGGKVVVGETLDQLGVHTELLGPGLGRGIGGPFRRSTAAQQERFRSSLQRVYAQFIEVVAAGRERTYEEILEVAEGRVWTGQQASERHLVDHLGGMVVALERVRVLAGLSSVSPRTQEHRFDPPRFSVLNLLLKRGAAQSMDPIGIALNSLGPSVQFIEALRASPQQALAIEPVPWDEDAWEAWR
jgi:protease-4